ncbi:2Fe-2S ferredoxin YfaE [Raoultella terrigena]|nr:2Fe-2S ferredoxin YfaE [Raoultella terrigena]
MGLPGPTARAKAMTVNPPQPSRKRRLIFEWQGQRFTGNNQQVLLEQLEQQGIRVPYSCRAGICGSCRIRLEEGEVNPLKKNAVAADGTILCCSCVPKTDLRLAP